MSDRVQAAVKWIQYAVQILGFILTLLGGSQAANIAPAAFGGGDEVAAGGNTLAGLALMFLTPAVAWAVKLVYGKTRGQKYTPVADLIAGETAVVTLETQLAGREPDIVALKGIRKSLAEVFSMAGKPVADTVKLP